MQTPWLERKRLSRGAAVKRPPPHANDVMHQNQVGDTNRNQCRNDVAGSPLGEGLG